jgi:aspartyl-tRNA(Asn)/glutamyl-tRNA(Gln) amidotransferase subunit A
MDEPTAESVQSHAEALSLPCDEATADSLAEQFAQQDALLDALDSLERPAPPDREFSEPDDDTDPNAAYLTRCDVGGGPGPLEGTSIAVKDNVAVAGVPMSCGSPLLTDFVPRRDATVVDRLLDQGARIVGKANMDEFAFGGDESTMRLRLARNPRAPDHQPGSSSAGSGVAVAEGSADAALGSDTGGSVRFPAAWCGVVGHKPTRGLVSHHGFVQFAKTLDTVGVLAADVDTAARVLTAIAGPDPRDERTLRVPAESGSLATPSGRREHDYAASVADVAAGDDELSDFTIGLPAELFGNAPPLDDVVHEALDELEAAGATLREVSIPDYDYWLPAWLAIGMTEVGAYLGGRAVNAWALHPGDPDLAAALGEAFAESPAELGDPLLSAWLYARHLVLDGDNRHYALAHQARRRLAVGVDDALADVDVLAATTVPMLPPKWGEGIDDVFGALSNTGPFNVTGHPATSVPAGEVDGLPVGLQFVAPRFGDGVALAAAAQWERLRED